MEKITTSLTGLPARPGVYQFKNSDGRVIYVGKAKNLAKRVRSYFNRAQDRDLKTRQLIGEIASLETVETLSEFDALLLEAKLINSLKPKYNTIAKDDKSPLYIVVTLSEELPHLSLARRTQIPLLQKHKKDLVFGPFQSTNVIRLMLRQLRQIWPYCLQKKRSGKPCFYTHLGLCQPCPSVIAKMLPSALRRQLVYDYRLNIRRLAKLLDGQAKGLLDQLEKEMKSAAREDHFEKAALLRDRMHLLYKLLERKYDPGLYLLTLGTLDIYQQELEELAKVLRPYYPQVTSLGRIECFDISNISGQKSSGSLAVLTAGRIDSAQYRRFRLMVERGPNDITMMAEVTRRRLKHADWTLPQLIVVDGGKGQIRAVQQTLREAVADIPVIGLAKRLEEVIVPHKDKFVTLRLPLSSGALHVLQRIRDEAHRFALNYHRWLRRKSVLPEE